MASSGMLTEKLILALNSAKDVIKSEDSQIVKNLMTSLNDNKEKFSDDSTMDELRAAVEARQQERANEDEVILGVEPEETTEEPVEETTEASPDEANEETKEEEDIMSKFKWVLISIGIFVFLIIVGSVFYWYFSSQPEETVMQPQSNIQLVSTPPPPQNVEFEPAKNYSYLPFMSAAVPNANKSNELEKQEQERKRIEQEAELKRIEEQQEKLKQEEEKRLQEERVQEEKLKQEEQRIQEEQQKIKDNKEKQEEEQRVQEEQQKIRDNKEKQEELIKQSLDDNKDLNNNSTYNISKSTPYTDTSSSSSESSDDENKEQKKGGKTKKQATKVKQVAKRKYVRKTK